MASPQTFLVTQEESGIRLDVFLATKTGKSRSSLQKLIRDGGVRVDEHEPTAHQKTEQGQQILLTWPDIIRSHETLQPEIVAETEDYVVLNKPAGLLTHGTPSGRETSLVDWLREHVPGIDTVGEPGRPGIVHRLDRDASGLLVAAKTPEAFTHLQEQFRNREVEKVYAALVIGAPQTEEGEIRFRLARSKRQRGKMAARPEGAEGKDALTHFQVLHRYNGATLLDVTIASGRTHQIRAHLFAMGLPLLGDRLYHTKRPNRLPDPGRLFLHAKLLSFIDQEGKQQRFTSELPTELQKTLSRLQEPGSPKQD